MKTESKLTKNQQLKLIDNAWREINYYLRNVSWGGYGNTYWEMNRKEEKDHDKMRPEGISRGISVNQAAKLFAAQQIAKYLLGDKPLDIKSYLYCRKSLYYAASLVENYREGLEKALKDIDLQELVKIDYCKLI